MTNQPRIRLSVNADATTALRFDDAEFVEAIRADGRAVEEDADGDEVKRPLAKLLGVPVASDFDFTPFVEDGWTLHAVMAVEGSSEDDLYSAAQTAKGKFDLAAFNARRWALWVTRVTVQDAEGMPPADRRVLDGLCGRSRRGREEAVRRLPTAVRAAFLARLRVHTDAAGRPAERDPKPAQDSTDEQSLVIQAS